MSVIIGIRANGGSSMGFGHVRRCLSLADALVTRGATVVFLVNSESTPDKWLPGRPVSVEIVPAEEAATLAATGSHIDKHGITALVVDSYEAGPDALRSIRVPVAAIVDAPPSELLPVSLLINGAADARNHEHEVPPGTRALLGPEFVLLSCAFESVPAKSITDRVAEILVTTGGSDGRGLCLLMAGAALRAVSTARVTVVAGPYFQPTVVEALTRLSSSDRRITLVSSPPTLHALMVETDVALTTGGQTTYELAATGTPACAVRLADNQTGNLKGLSALGTLDWVGDADDPRIEFLLEHALARLAIDKGRRQVMARAGQTVVDGHGAARVATAVLELCA